MPEFTPVYQSSYTRRFGAVCGWPARPRQGRIVGTGHGDELRLYQFQGERWVLIEGVASHRDPTDPGSPWPVPVPVPKVSQSI